MQKHVTLHDCTCYSKPVQETCLCSPSLLVPLPCASGISSLKVFHDLIWDFNPGLEGTMRSNRHHIQMSVTDLIKAINHSGLISWVGNVYCGHASHMSQPSIACRPQVFSC